MLGSQLTRSVAQLKRALGEKELFALGRETGFEKRARSITTLRFVTSLVQSLGTRRVESIADLLRDFNRDHDTEIYYKPYYNRLDCAGFPELMRKVFEAMMGRLCAPVLKPAKDGPFRRFKDIIIHDGTSFALHDSLAEALPGRFTKVSPAAIELHTTMSLFHDNFTCVTAAADSESERNFLPAPTGLRDRLFLADRGFDSTPFMQEIERHDGHFIIRLRSSLDPRVDRIHRAGSRYRALEGQRLSAVIQRLPKGKLHDIDVESRDGWRARLVLKWAGPDHCWIRLITDLGRDDFDATEILQAYRLRWQIELYYKELKSYANLHAFCTSKPYIAEGLIWAALCAAFLKRYIAHACQRTSRDAISTRRVSMCSHSFLREFFQCLRQGFRGLRGLLDRTFRFLRINARRSNLNRERHRGRLALGLELAGPTAGRALA